MLVHEVAPEVTAALVSAVPEAFGGHVNDGLLAGLARAVRGWQQARGIEDVAPVSVLVEGHGRVDEVLETGPDGCRVDLTHGGVVHLDRPGQCGSRW